MLPSVEDDRSRRFHKHKGTTGPAPAHAAMADLNIVRRDRRPIRDGTAEAVPGNLPRLRHQATPATAIGSAPARFAFSFTRATNRSHGTTMRSWLPVPITS